MKENKILANKKILFICIEFYEYHINIQKKLESLGAQVDYFPPLPKSKTYQNIRRLFKKFGFFNKINKIIQIQYENNIFEKIQSQSYDYFLLIGGKHLSSSFLPKLKNIQKNTIFLKYMWDPIVFFDNFNDTFHFFDKVLSFDPNDCKNDNRLTYLPLFYLDEFNRNTIGINEDIDILFVGNYHSDRANVINNIKKEALKYNLKFYIYLYMPYIVWLKLKIFKKDSLFLIDKSDIKFTPLIKEDLLNLIQRSKSVLDVHIPTQSGLTIRTFESIKSGKKLITTNDSIKDEVFFNSNCIHIIDRGNIFLKPDFFNNKCSYKIELIMQYSLENWLLNIFSKT